MYTTFIEQEQLKIQFKNYQGRNAEWADSWRGEYLSLIPGIGL